MGKVQRISNVPPAVASRTRLIRTSHAEGDAGPSRTRPVRTPRAEGGASPSRARPRRGRMGGRGRRPRRPAPGTWRTTVNRTGDRASGRLTRSARRHRDTENGFEAGLRAASSATSSATKARRPMSPTPPDGPAREGFAPPPGAGRPTANREGAHFYATGLVCPQSRNPMERDCRVCKPTLNLLRAFVSPRAPC